MGNVGQPPSGGLLDFIADTAPRPIPILVSIDARNLGRKFLNRHVLGRVAGAALGGDVVELTLVVDEVARELEIVDLLVDRLQALVHDLAAALCGGIALSVQVDTFLDFGDRHARCFQAPDETRPFQIVFCVDAHAALAARQQS